MEFRILGPMELWASGASRQPGWAKERGVLAVLLMAPGRPVAVESLIERVWEHDTETRVRAALHTQIARLRRRLEAMDDQVRLHYRAGAYTLDADPEQVDYHRFARLCAQARSIADSGDTEHAAALLREALRLWRGTPLSGIEGAWAERTRRTIEDELVGGALDRFKIELARGRHAQVINELDRLAARFPHHEKLAESLMLALYRDGRSGDALHVFHRLRERLAADLGAVPHPETSRLHRRILAGDPGLTLPRRPYAAQAPSSLPRDLHTFTGRTAELTRLTALAEGGPTVTVIAIDGMPGVGKSTLAVHLAHRLADRYPDGQIFLHLRAHHADHEPLDGGLALKHLLLAVGVPADEIPTDVEARAARWRGAVAARRILLVLDDALGNDQIRLLLPGTPGCLVIVTSRRRLVGLEAVRPVSLGVLPPAEAVALLARVAERALDPADPAVRAVVGLCGGLPLAVQLVGGRLLHRPGWTVGDLAERLSGGRGRLAEIRAENRDLTAVFALSYEGLDERLRVAFRLLGLHPGLDVTADDTAVLLGTDRATAGAMLEELLDYHLIEDPSRGRYRFHDLIGEYASRLAALDPPPDAEAALDRLTDHYLATAARADALLYPRGDRPAVTAVSPCPPSFADADGARGWLDAESDNLLRVASDAVERGRGGRAAGLAAVLAPHLESTGRWADAARLHERAAAVWSDLGEHGSRIRALADLSKIYWRSGRYAEALRRAHEGLESARSHGDGRAVAGFLLQIGQVHWHLAEFDVALGYLQQALAGFRECADEGDVGEALNNLGIVLCHLGRYGEAADHFRAALDTHTRLGADEGRQIALNNIGDLEQMLGNYDVALDFYLRARDVKEMRRQHQAVWLSNVATVYRRTGRAAEAIGEYRKALAIYREIGDLRGECDSLNHIGTCFTALGRDGEALIHHQKALQSARELSERYEQTLALLGIGELHLRAGRYAAARERFEESLALARSIADVRQEASALAGIGEVVARTRGAAVAEPYRRQALELFSSLGVREADVLQDRLLSPDDIPGA
ncbi:AfsR/SARP family transcriptional regulator [Actinomadura rayongensis]|uniref:Tetratricopeptide repeat protein n=1 Tax=Actinomadura rayongensis TaxID=1429076 RepID=A0A6I4WCI1_9ACTN|nr:tetratricopeptide repeat protein [Actinomadura rayongensis]MXQ67907.1 tetratricopeptide repeat protein [Actinomadura rayongensis]